MASAYKIQLRYPEARIGVFEKEAQLAAHQTGRNSGVIHSGLYYKSGSFKAKNCIQGRKELVEFAVEQGIEHDICGKVIVATDESELANLERVFQNGLANEIEGLEKLLLEIVPYLQMGCYGIGERGPVVEGLKRQHDLVRNPLVQLHVLFELGLHLPRQSLDLHGHIVHRFERRDPRSDPPSARAPGDAPARP